MAGGRSGGDRAGPGDLTACCNETPAGKSRSQGGLCTDSHTGPAGVGTVGGRCLAGRVLLHDLVTTSAEVASTRSRKAKVVALAALLSRTRAEDVGLVLL